MKKRALHSHLQNRILLHMVQNEVSSLTDLARKLAAHRSSVSRAMHSLLNSSLVSNKKGNWELTTKGRGELKRIKQSLSERTTKAAMGINRLVDQNLLAGLSPNTFSVNLLPPYAGIYDTSKMKINDAVYNPLNIYGSSPNTVIPSNEASDYTKIGLYNGSKSIISSLKNNAVSFDSINPLRANNALNLNKETENSLVMSSFEASPNYLANINTGSISGVSMFDAIKSAHFSSEVYMVKSISANPTLTEIASSQIAGNIDYKNQSIIVGLSSKLAQEAITSFSQSQRLSLSSIEQVSVLGPGSSHLISELSEANINLGKIINDVGVINSQSFTEQSIKSEVAILMPNVAEVARTYNGYFADMVGDLGKSLGDYNANLGMSVPTRVTTEYIGTAKNFFVFDKPVTQNFNIREPFGVPWQDWVIELDDALRSLGSNYIDMWHGAWAVLKSDSPDRIRQAAHSGRELLIQFIEELAPDSAFDAIAIKEHGHNGKITRKMRVMKILGVKSRPTINWADAVVRAIENMHEYLAAVSHDRDTNRHVTEKQVAGFLHTLGGLLEYIEGFRH